MWKVLYFCLVKIYFQLVHFSHLTTIVRQVAQDLYQAIWVEKYTAGVLMTTYSETVSDFS